jgi:D-alanyl-D-alanine carboxypeptidase
VIASISPSDWEIQLGAYPTKEDAQATLKKARAAGLSFLDGKQAFTIEVQKGSDTIFRARFSGFSEKSAKDACRDLAQRGMACMALAPQS